MQTLTDSQVAELLAQADGDVSYRSQYSKTTALVSDGRWTRKSYAYDYLRELIEAERKATYIAPQVPQVSAGPRSMPYTGPFPRGRHSHKCRGCEHKGQFNAVACYKSQCRKPQLTATCEYCRAYFAS